MYRDSWSTYLNCIPQNISIIPTINLNFNRFIYMAPELIEFLNFDSFSSSASLGNSF